jgi:hypothetical protein
LEEIGHLGDLESLWLGRIDDFMQGREILREADLSNRKTHTANHNSSTAAVLIDTFARQRRVLTRTIRELKDDDLERISLHPRLKTPMRVVDLAYFIAEHDDHHLTRITSAAGR